MIECRSCSKTQDPDLFTNDMVRREAGKPQDRQNKLRDFEHTIKITISKLKPLLEYVSTITRYGYLLKDHGSLEDLFNLLTSECSVFRALFKRKFGDLDGDHVLSTMYRYVQNQDSMIVLSAMFRMAIVAGYSTSTVENSFSARNRVDTDRRRRLSPYKQGDLSLFHFESALLQSLTFEDFLKVWKEKSRRLKV